MNHKKLTKNSEPFISHSATNRVKGQSVFPYSASYGPHKHNLNCLESPKDKKTTGGPIQALDPSWILGLRKIIQFYPFFNLCGLHVYDLNRSKSLEDQKQLEDEVSGFDSTWIVRN